MFQRKEREKKKHAMKVKIPRKVKPVIMEESKSLKCSECGQENGKHLNGYTCSPAILHTGEKCELSFTDTIQSTDKEIMEVITDTPQTSKGKDEKLCIVIGCNNERREGYKYCGVCCRDLGIR